MNVEIAESVLFQNLKDEVVVLNMTSQQYYGLNDVGADMWKSLLEHGSLEKASQALSRIYKVDEKTLDADLRQFVTDLLDAGVLKTV